MASLRLTPNGETAACRSVRYRSRRADRVKHRVRRARADKIRVRSRPTKPLIVGRGDDVTALEEVAQPGDASEQPAVRTRFITRVGPSSAPLSGLPDPFSDTLAAVRRETWREVWRKQGFVTSRCAADMTKLRPALQSAITYALCHAA